jgi:hypothetical protein
LTLDGGGDSNSIFVIKTNGALCRQNTNVLTNGAQARNVFWLAYGSPSLVRTFYYERMQ